MHLWLTRFQSCSDAQDCAVISVYKQVSLVAAANGFHEPLFQVLESALGTELGVGSVVAQPQPGLSAKQAAVLGYRPLTPADAADLHLAMPVAFLDAPVLGKALT